MPIYIGIFFLMANLLVFTRSDSKGIYLYFILCLVCPHISIHGNNIPYEVIGFALLSPIIVISLIARKNDLLIPKLLPPFLFYLIIYLFSTIVSILYYTTAEVLWIPVFGHIRLVFFVLIISRMLKDTDDLFEKILFYVLICNLLLSLIQLFIPGTISIFYKLYFKESMVPLATSMELGRFSRATGSFGTPVYLGMFSLICFSFYYGLLLMGARSKRIAIGIMAAIICGLISITKTFLMGMPIVLITGFILNCMMFWNRSKSVITSSIKFILLFSGILILPIWYLLIVAINSGINVIWYFETLNDPLKALESRYDVSEGVLAVTRTVIKDNLLSGVGATIPFGEFTGDSFYLYMLHDTGIIGAVILGLVFLQAIIISFRQRSVYKILMIISLLLSGLSYPSVLNLLGVLVLSYIISNQKTILTGSTSLTPKFT